MDKEKSKLEKVRYTDVGEQPPLKLPAFSQQKAKPPRARITSPDIEAVHRSHKAIWRGLDYSSAPFRDRQTRCIAVNDVLNNRRQKGVSRRTPSTSDIGRRTKNISTHLGGIASTFPEEVRRTRMRTHDFRKTENSSAAR